MDSVGERIRQLRTSKGMTQETLAKKLETTKAAISRYELGQRVLHMEQAQAIADALDVSVYELYGLPSEREIWMANARKTLALIEKQIQHNLGLEQTPDEMRLTQQVNEGLQAAADELKQQLQAEINNAAVMQRIQMQADAVSQAAEVPEKIAPADKQRNKRLDSLVMMFNKHPDDAQNRILEVVSTFERLTSAGQKQAVKRVKELAELAKYQAKRES